MAAIAKKMTYEFTTDDDELNDSTTDQSTMCNFYKLNLPANASLLSKQIAKSQAKRAERDERRRRSRRKDLSTVREQDEVIVSPSPTDAAAASAAETPENGENEEPLAASEQSRSRIDAVPPAVKMKQQASLPTATPADSATLKEPMDEEEARLVAMLLSGMTIPEVWRNPTEKQAENPNKTSERKVSEWLLERSASPDDLLSIGTGSLVLEDSGLVHDDDEDDVFFDAEDEKKDVVMLGHEMQGLSLNRNMAMTQSLFKVEEELSHHDDKNMGFNLTNIRNSRSTSVSPRPASLDQQFSRNSPASATFNVKHSSTLSRHQKFTPSPQTTSSLTNSVPSNGNVMTASSHHLDSTTPLTSRATRSVLRVHNVNSAAAQLPSLPNRAKANINNSNNTRGNEESTPPLVTMTTPSRPPSVASSAGRSSQPRTSNLEGLQDLIHMQEEALRRAAFDGTKEQIERKLSWHSDMEANRQSTSTHSSIGSLSSSKSVDAPNALNRAATAVATGRTTPISKIPAPRSRLPTPRGSNLPKRVHSVAAAVRFTTSKPQCTGNDDNRSGGRNEADECF